MNKRHITISSIIALISSFVIAFALIFTSSPHLNLKMNASNAHSVEAVTSTALTLDNSYVVSITSSGLTSSNLLTLSNEGYFYNSDPIRGITNITLTYDEGSHWAKIVPCFYNYESDSVVTTTEDWGDAVSSKDFANPIDYFEIFNANEDTITITSIVITYECTTSSYDFNISFTPDWSGNTAETHADIYIAGTAELISDGTTSGDWKYQKMTYNAGTYTYSISHIPTGMYDVKFYASINGNAINWNNASTEGLQTITIDGNTSFTTTQTWASEPGSSTTYILNVVYYETASGAWSTWCGFNYSTSDSAIASGTWGETLGYVSKSGGILKYTYSIFQFESTSTTVYVAVKLGARDESSSIDPAYIGKTTALAIPVSYSGGATTATLTINMTMSSVSSTYAATSYSVETNGTAVEGMSHSDVSMKIYDLAANDSSITNGRVKIEPSFTSGSDTFTASFSGDNIRIDTIGGEQYITALKAGTSTEVTLTCDSDNSVTCSFTVSVPSSSYSATSTRDGLNSVASSEGWFTSTSVDEISTMDSDFINGIDISIAYALYENGSNFYNADGVEQSLFYILKDNHVNWIRLKLWLDPYTSNDVSYGGGESDLSHTLWLAYEAEKAGLDVLLDFHYSDYWTHPGQQVLPKAWSSASSVSEVAAYIKSYTKDTLNTFNSYDCLPEMVQLGNEISSGSFLQYPGTDSDTFTDYQPSYLNNAVTYAYKASSGSDNMNTYLSAGVEAVNEINTSLSSDIKTVVHWAKGSSISSSVIYNFFKSITADYDYAAVSYYPYYCFDNITDASTYLNGLVSLGKPWFIAECAYPFTSSYVYENSTSVTNNTISKWYDSSISGYRYGPVSNGVAQYTNIYSSYDYTPSGQANLIHDLTNVVNNLGGLGIFYWESAWIPNINVGWAGSGSPTTYSNQGFFSFDGKAIANLDLFAQMNPNY